MVVLFKTLQVILALSILIIAHELGHFTFAKLFHIRVEKFYLFFDVGGKALLRFNIGETEFGIGWLPFGGYCKIAGMVDESMDVQSLKKDPQPWEFRTHPAGQRLLVMAGGVLYNFIFAILTYSAIIGIWGTAYIPNSEASIYPNELAREMGFMTGDRILSMDGYVPEDFSELQADLVRRNVHCVSVLRGSDTVKVYIDQALTAEMLNSPFMFDIALPFVVDSCSNANGAVLQKGDEIKSIGGAPSKYLQDASPLLGQYAGGSVEAVIERDGKEITVPLQVDSTGKIGVFITPPPVQRQRYSALEAIPAGIKKTGSTIGGYLKDLRMVANPQTGAYRSVGSFISIGQIFPKVWDWYQFLNIIALLSIMLGVMNLLPIPGLDGGHILFTLYEIVSGRKPSDKFLMVMQMIGMILLLMLMFLAFGNDISRLF